MVFRFPKGFVKQKRHISIGIFVLGLLLALIIGYVYRGISDSSYYAQNYKTTQEYAKLAQQKNSVQSENLTLLKKLAQETQNNLGARKPPYIVFSSRQVSAVFKKLDGSLEEWRWPADTYQAAVKQGYFTREFIPDLLLPLYVTTINGYTQTCTLMMGICASQGTNCAQCADNINSYNTQLEQLKKQGVQYLSLSVKGTGNVTVMDFSPFVNGKIFEKVVQPLYSRRTSNEQFVKEMWNMVTQLTIYSTELQETPRYPLETLSEAGGDCEDTAILFASLLKAANANWKIRLVYMDSDNPTELKKVNHVMVYVDDRQGYTALIDTTQHTTMIPYTEVGGYYLDV